MAGACLVTGATGFAGGHLLEHLLERDASVAAWFNPAGHSPSSDDSRVHWYGVDLLDRHAVHRAVAKISPRAIYHCGGVADVSNSWSQPARALQVNAVGTLYLVESVHAAGLDCPVLVTGSAHVYRPSSNPMREDWAIAPFNPYGLSKLAQEMAAGRDRRHRTYLTRSFNHAGPRQAPSYVTSSFAQQLAEIEAGLREPVLRVGNLDARRDITDVRDTVRAYRLILERGQPGRPYNVCSGRAYRTGELLETLTAMARVSVSVATDPARLRPSDTPLVLGDRSRLTDETGWEPSIPIERTLADLLDYWRGRTTAPVA